MDQVKRAVDELKLLQDATNSGNDYLLSQVKAMMDMTMSPQPTLPTPHHFSTAQGSTVLAEAPQHVLLNASLYPTMRPANTAELLLHPLLLNSPGLCQFRQQLASFNQLQQYYYQLSLITAASARTAAEVDGSRRVEQSTSEIITTQRQVPNVEETQTLSSPSLTTDDCPTPVKQTTDTADIATYTYCRQCKRKMIKSAVHVCIYTRPNGLECSLCKQQFLFYSNARRHVKYVHLRSYRPYQCGGCLRRFLHPYELRNHLVGCRDAIAANCSK